MGLFDTIYGTIKCPHCNQHHKFFVQTKDFNCAMKLYSLGDRIDFENEGTYVYTIYDFCEEADKNNKISKFNINVIIVNGQIVKFCNDNEIKNINIDKLKNIEKGLGKRLEYEESCKKGVGFDNVDTDMSILLKKGDRIKALNNDWLITDVFREVLSVTKEPLAVYTLHKSFFKYNIIYKVTNKLGDRIVRVTANNMEVMYPSDDVCYAYDYENPNKYYIQLGCILCRAE